MQKPLRGPALSESIRDYIKEYIIEHKLEAGDPLPAEPQLMEELGVGRSSVREAIKALQSLGIVEIRPGNGQFVRAVNFDPVLETLTFNMRLDHSMFAEVLQMRVWLEAAVIDEAVERISDEAISELELLMQTWEDRVHAGESVADLDEQFHYTLFETVNNVTLIKFFEVFWLAFDNLDKQPVRTTADARQVLEDHWLLLDAVKRRDTVLAKERLISHFSHVRERFQQPVLMSEAV